MKVLIVEDEDDLRSTLADSLREHGYAVDASADGEEGLYRALESDYDAVVLDLMLPGIDGWEVLRRLRQEKTTPVLLLTSRRALQDRVQGLDLGADDYLTKPFDLEEAQARLRALIRRSKGAASARITLPSGVVLDTARREILLEGRVLDLTAREYSLIEYLALHRGEVVSRADLYEHLFAEDDETFSNLLEVHVCNVRKKIGKDFIQTRRGHGYALAEN
ncbi:MAG: response regulator transcription factor [Burkholderiales bacterium]|nr:response regulator transcription factor [Opitutaceae bacterium]